MTDFSKLLNIFWKDHDPTITCSRQYMSVIFYHNAEQKALAEKTMEKERDSHRRQITTLILPAETFYEAEGYHQKYLLQKHPYLLEALDIDPDDLIGSHVAARLNGYVGGYGSPKNFDDEWKKLGLNEKMADYVRRVIKNGYRGV